MLNILALTLAVATAGPGQMATLIGRDQVTAAYPGFHKVEGDASALAASGTDRHMPNGWGKQDAIVIRRIATLGKKQTATFDLTEAQKLAAQYEDRSDSWQTVAAQPFAHQTKVSVCGWPAYGFSRVEHITQAVLNTKPVDWTEFDTFVIVVIGQNVWRAAYTRLYEPGLEGRAAQLITFASNFCVKRL